MGKFREGKTLVQFWIDDSGKAKWEASIKGNQSNFIRQAVEEKILRDNKEAQVKKEPAALTAERSDIVKLMEAKFAEILARIGEHKAPVPPATVIALKSKILKYLKNIGRPGTWEEIVDIMGDGDKDATLVCLKELGAAKIIGMNPQGNYFLKEVENK